jgi:hypothetical protein
MESRMPKKKRTILSVMLSILLSWCIASFSPVFSQSEETRLKEPLSRLLPLESDLKGWKLDGEPETAEGIGLFELINGGAEEYVREGFKRAVMATYRNKEGKLINLDIFEMLSPESARSIHGKKVGAKETKVSVGDEGAVGDYYVNFRKGAYHVTLSGYDSQKETLEWLLHMGRLVAERIGTSP